MSGPLDDVDANVRIRRFDLIRAGHVDHAVELAPNQLSGLRHLIYQNGFSLWFSGTFVRSLIRNVVSMFRIKSTLYSLHVSLHVVRGL